MLQKRRLLDKSFIFFLLLCCAKNIICEETDQFATTLKPSDELSGVTSNESEKEVCTTEACRKISSEIFKKMNHSVKPCDNFYEYVCGNFSKNAIIPDDEQKLDIFTVLSKKVREQLHTSIENNITEKDPHSFNTLQSYYNICMNEGQIERNSKIEFLEILNNTGGWPVLMGNSWNESDFDWESMIKKFYDLGYSSNYIIQVEIKPNWKNNSANIINIDQASFGIDKIYLSQGLNDEVVQAYFKYMVDVAEIFGANRDQAKKELNESLCFEIELAKNSDDSWNTTVFSALNMSYPNVFWVNYVNRLLNPHEKINLLDQVRVDAPNFFEKLGKLLEETPKRVLANYLYWRMVAESVEYLSERVLNLKRELFKTLYGSANITPRWEYCVELVNQNLYLATSSLYIRRFFNKNSKNSTLEMIKEFKVSLHEMLSKAEWMRNDTKELAFIKLDNMLPLVAYSDKLLDDKLLDSYYEELIVRNDSFLKTSLNYNLFSRKLNIKSLRNPVLRDDWTESFRATAVINGFYHLTKNALVLAAGILQGEFFTEEHPKYINFGAIGHIIGHEISHSFDSLGRLFDNFGNYNDWWDSESKENYLQKQKCIVEQYNNYTVKEVSLNVSGTNTHGENIADIGGLKVAYYAYKEWVKKNGEEPLLPDFKSSTPKKLFWISFANAWCAKYRLEYLRDTILTDQHAPSEFRIIGSISNVKEFSEDFDCPVGSNMNPAHKCTFW